jgi:hypothetical protein
MDIRLEGWRSRERQPEKVEEAMAFRDCPSTADQVCAEDQVFETKIFARQMMSHCGT